MGHNPSICSLPTTSHDSLQGHLEDNRAKMENIAIKGQLSEADRANSSQGGLKSSSRSPGPTAASPAGRRGSARPALSAPGGKPMPPASLSVWRVRVHAARRRVMLIIITAQRLRRGHRHPSRLPRLDDMGWFIPCGLGDNMESFVRELLKYQTASDQVTPSLNEPNRSLSIPPFFRCLQWLLPHPRLRCSRKTWTNMMPALSIKLYTTSEPPQH